MPPLRILIVDDHSAVRRGIANLLSSYPDWSVAGEAYDGLNAVELARTLRPDLILMDISMPRMDGLHATRTIRRELPESRVLLVSQNEPAMLGRAAADAGAEGCIHKSGIARELIPTLKRMVQERAAGAHSTLPASGEMSDLIRAKDWAETPIGPRDAWSPALRMMVDFMLSNRFPLLLWWGPQYISIYNDAYIPVLGKKHPWALGQPVSKCWEEIWSVLQPLIDSPFYGGPSTWMEDIELEVRRSDFTEETHFTVAYSPVPDGTAPRGIGGVLATVHETTEAVVSDRRVGILATLGARATQAETAAGAGKAAADALGFHPKDFPFALVYLIDRNEKKAKLVGAAGCKPGEAISPLSVDIESGGVAPAWPFVEVAGSKRPVIVERLQERFSPVPKGPWQQPPERALVAPIPSTREHCLSGLLVAGLSSHLALDSRYERFITMAAAQIGADIAHAQAYEEERKQAEALAEIDRAKTAFFSNVSHEFRTPLTLVLGQLESLIEKPSGLDSQQREQIESAHRNSLRLLKLVNALLDFSRIEAGRAQPQFESIDLSAYTAELASVFRSTMEKAGLKYVVDCPPLAQTAFIDRGMWEKIVFNLLSNAFKFTLRGEVRVAIRIENGMGVLSVSDTGSGIPPEELPHVFERFHRVETTHGRSYEGAGIGLALALEMTKLHGGAIEVESEPGAGTTFRVRIPLGEKEPASSAQPQDAAHPSLPRAEIFIDEALSWLPYEGRERSSLTAGTPPSPEGSEGSHRPRILLADDNAGMRDYLCRLMAPLYDVEAVENGAAALAAARGSEHDLVLSDIMMPEMNGLELAAALRSDKDLSSIPIILLSARAGEEARVEGLAHAADDYLIKPFSARELMARIGAHLKLSSARKESEEALRRLASSLEAEVQSRTAELQAQAAKMRDLSGRLLEVQDSERRRLARELHDSAGQILAALALNISQMAQASDKTPPRMAAAAAEATRLIEERTREIRAISYLLHPPLLDDNGLAEALGWYVKGLAERSGLQIDLSASDDFERLPKELELNVFRVVQECLTNVHRHSGGKHATVRLGRDGGAVLVEVADDGQGIAADKLTELQTGGSGVGIRGMQERVRRFQGKMTLESKGQGTTVRLVFPAVFGTGLKGPTDAGAATPQAPN